jgi:predicted MFS family arabinose efflux permease
MTTRTQALLTLLGGTLTLVLAIGLGRFAYTPLLPLLQRDLGVTDTAAAYLATANYTGYLLGALWLSRRHSGNNQLLLIWGFALNGFCLLGMGLTSQFGIWLLLRFIGGLAGAWLFILASSRVLLHLAQIHRLGWSGYLYAGTGLGISITGASSAWLDSLGGWRGGWLGFGLFSLVLGALSLWLLSRYPPPAPTTNHAPSPIRRTALPPDSLLPWLLTAYFLEGIGYIISGTFLVVLIARLPEFTGQASDAWVVVGLAGIPASIFWAWLAERGGLVRTLVLAHLLQAFGLCLPLLNSGLWGVYGGALLFGGTFMGIVGLTLSLGKQLAPQRATQIIGQLTLALGIGQVIGPLLTAQLSQHSDGLPTALLLASASVAAGALALALGSLRHKPVPTLQTVNATV